MFCLTKIPPIHVNICLSDIYIWTCLLSSLMCDCLRPSWRWLFYYDVCSNFVFTFSENQRTMLSSCFLILCEKGLHAYIIGRENIYIYSPSLWCKRERERERGKPHHGEGEGAPIGKKRSLLKGGIIATSLCGHVTTTWITTSLHK